MSKLPATVIAVAASLACAAPVPAAAQSDDQRLRLLEATIQDLVQRDETKDQLIRELQEEVGRLRAGDRGDAASAAGRPGEHAHAAHAHGERPPGEHRHDHGGHAEPVASHGGPPDLYAVGLGDGTTLRFKGIAVNTALAAGYSSVTDGGIENLQGGHHDPNRNGFTLQAADLSFTGGLDPYFHAETNLTMTVDAEGETSVELEEAFLRTLPGALPAGLELEVGQFFTEFGAYNPLHLHDHAFVDQPVAVTRFFGEDGLRGQGFRASWTPAPGPWRPTLHLGMQNATGESQYSFLSSDEAFDERPIGGRAYTAQDVDAFDEFTWLARLAIAGEAGGAAVSAGVSGLYGANATGPKADTYILGADFALSQALDRGRFWQWQTEVMFRRYEAAEDVDNGFVADTLRDFGIYSQFLYGFAPEWAAGLRYEYASGSGESVGPFAGRRDDPFRDDRHRLSPLLAWQFAPTASIRAQYNFDHADHLDDRTAHAFWLAFRWSFGMGSAVHAHAPGSHAH